VPNSSALYLNSSLAAHAHALGCSRSTCDWMLHEPRFRSPYVTLHMVASWSKGPGPLSKPRGRGWELMWSRKGSPVLHPLPLPRDVRVEIV
jgi:hypothetical protein